MTIFGQIVIGPPGKSISLIKKNFNACLMHAFNQDLAKQNTVQ